MSKFSIAALTGAYHEHPEFDYGFFTQLNKNQEQDEEYPAKRKRIEVDDHAFVSEPPVAVEEEKALSPSTNPTVICNLPACCLCSRGIPPSFSSPPTWAEVCYLAMYALAEAYPERTSFHIRKDVCAFIDSHYSRLYQKPRSSVWKQTVNMTLSHPQYSNLFIQQASLENGRKGFYSLKQVQDPYLEADFVKKTRKKKNSQTSPEPAKRRRKNKTYEFIDETNEYKELKDDIVWNMVEKRKPLDHNESETEGNKELDIEENKELEVDANKELEIDKNNDSLEVPVTSTKELIKRLEREVFRCFLQHRKHSNSDDEDDNGDDEDREAWRDQSHHDSPLSSTKGKGKRNRQTTKPEEKEVLEQYYMQYFQHQSKHSRRARTELEELAHRLGWKINRIQRWLDNRRTKDKSRSGAPEGSPEGGTDNLQLPAGDANYSFDSGSPSDDNSSTHTYQEQDIDNYNDAYNDNDNDIDNEDDDESDIDNYEDNDSGINHNGNLWFSHRPS
jgi:hypothetical protein